MSNLLLVLPLGLASIPILLTLRRRPHTAVGYWALAGIVLWATGLVLALHRWYPPLLALAHVVAPVSASLVLLGAHRFVHRPAATWVPRFGSAAALLTAVAFYASGPVAAGAAAIGGSVPLLADAGLTVWRHARRTRAGVSERALGIALLLSAVVMPVDVWVRLRTGIEFALLPYWVTLVFSISFLTLASIAERARRRARRLGDERELLRRVALALADTRDPHLALARIGDEIRDSRSLRFFGIWALDADGSRLERLEHGAAAHPLPERWKRIRSDAPLVRELLASSEPRPLDALLGDSRLGGEINGLSRGPGYVASLRSGGRSFGLLAVALSERDAGAPSARAFVQDLADEIALVLDHVALARAEQQQRRELEVERRTLRALVESSPLGVVLVDRQGRIRYANRHAAELVDADGPEQWLGAMLTDLWRELRPRLAAEAELELDTQLSGLDWARPDAAGVDLRFASGRILNLLSRPVCAEDGALLGQVWIGRDVTGERRFTERLQQAQRMETVGQLASGLAHDFNNQLTTILGNAALLLQKLSPESELRRSARDLERAAVHCADLTRGLLSFSRREPPTLRPVSVAPILEEVAALLRPGLPPGVELEVAVEDDVGDVLADPGQLIRVLTNLVLNARDAVAAGGRIRIESRTSSDGQRIELVVADDGAGMDDATRQRSFDPFFTTKESGRGTGLGLSVVHGISEAHGAVIEVESAPGRGSRFVLLWPAAKAAGS